jgi:hypothetical protein
VVRVAVIPSGVASDRPGELLGSAKMQRFIERLKKITDVIILDCAPLVVASDVVPLLPQADGVIIVARARQTRKELAGSTAALLERMGTATAGVVLNDAREFSIPLAKRRMYRPTRKMRKAAQRNAPSQTEEASTLDPFVLGPPVVDEVPVVVDPQPEPVVEPERVVEPQPVVEPVSGGSGDGGNGSRPTIVLDPGASEVRVPEASPSGQLRMLAAERMVQIPPAEEALDQFRPLTPELPSLHDQLVKLRTQLEELQLELPDIGLPGSDGSSPSHAANGTPLWPDEQGNLE